MSGFLQAAGVWIDGGDAYPSRLPPRNATLVNIPDSGIVFSFAPSILVYPLQEDSQPPARLSAASYVLKRAPFQPDRDLSATIPFFFLVPPPSHVTPQVRTYWPTEVIASITPDPAVNVWIQPPAPPRLPASALMAAPHSAASADPLLTVYAFPVDFWFSDPSPPRAIKQQRGAPTGDGPGIVVIVEPFWDAAVQPIAHAPQYAKPRLPLHVATTGELASNTAENLAAPLWQAAIQAPAHAPRPFRKLNISEAAPWVQDTSIPFTSGAFYASLQATAPPRRLVPHTPPEATAFQTAPVWIGLPPWPFPQDPGPPSLPRQGWRLHSEWAYPPPIAAGVITVAGPYYAVASNVYQQGAAEGDASTFS